VIKDIFLCVIEMFVRCYGKDGLELIEKIGEIEIFFSWPFSFHAARGVVHTYLAGTEVRGRPLRFT
jgi:hypothetical protein